MLPYNTVSGDGSWTINASPAPTGGSYDLKLYLNGFTGLTDNQFGPLKRPSGSTNSTDWESGGTLALANGDGRLVSNGYAKRMGLTSFSEMGIGTSTTPLPIVLMDFTGSWASEDIKVDWTTASEYNVSHFELERSLDGINFQKVNAQKAYGESVVEQRYSYVDKEVYSNQIFYYRLKSIDNDSTFAHSPVIAVSPLSDSGDWKITAMPNPFARSFSVNYQSREKGKATALLFDITGKTVGKWSWEAKKGGSQKLIEMTGPLDSGIYILQISLPNQMPKALKLRHIR